jgi:hypothetical protein
MKEGVEKVAFLLLNQRPSQPFAHRTKLGVQKEGGPGGSFPRTVSSEPTPAGLSMEALVDDNIGEEFSVNSRAFHDSWKPSPKAKYRR